jgi:hypothetical protein
MGHTVGEMSWKKRGFCLFSLSLWQSVLRLAVRGNSISGRVVRRQRVPVFEWHRLLSTGSRWYIRWVSGRGKTLFVVCLALRLWKESFEACGEGE